jgi:organic hydroperoxide reductase OsmC/OhrA
VAEREESVVTGGGSGVLETPAESTAAAAEIHSSYPVTLSWLGEKRGRIGSPDGLADIDIASPPQFGGHPFLWSPEHLFVASALACWMTTFVAIAGNSKLEVVAIEGGADGEVAMNESRRYEVSGIVLRPRITVRREEDREKAMRIAEKAEGSCLIARSMRTPVALAAEVVVAG